MAAVSNRKFNIVILAAGIGKRLRPLTLVNPKPLVSIKGKTIISRLINNIPAKNVSSLNIVVGYKAELVEDSVKNMNLPYAVNFYRSTEFDKTHCSSSLAIVSKILEKGALLFNADIVFNNDVLENIINSEQKSSFVVCKKANANSITDLQKVVSINGIIKKWDLELKDFTSEVTRTSLISFACSILE